MSAALVVCAVVLLAFVTLFIKGYRDAGPGSLPGAAGGSGASGAPERPGPSRTEPGDPFFPSNGARLPAHTITPAEPGGIVFGTLPTHTIVMSASSTGRIGRLGYLVPTSPNASSGIVPAAGSHWSLTTKAVGRPQYAAVFIQAGPSGTPITCTISVDGHVKDTRTTSGPSGRTVCVA